MAGRSHSRCFSLLRRLSSAGVAVASLAFLAPSIAFADFDAARRSFASLDRSTRVEVILRLIATGDFDGLLTHGFTKRLYNSIVAFERRERLVPDGSLEPYEISRLKERSRSFLRDLGLRSYVHPSARSELLVPRLAFDTEKRTANGYAFERNDENLSLSFDAYAESEKSFDYLHGVFTARSDGRTVTYELRRDDFFVVSGKFRGRMFYTWMSRVPGGSTGFTVSWKPQWQALGSRVSTLLANAFIPENASTNVPPPPPPPPRQQEAAVETPPSPSEPDSSSGTGFQVTSAGHVLTNFHVVGKCKSILLRKTGELPVPADLVAGDETNDLALIKARDKLGGPVARFRTGAPVRAGSEIVVFGFPLAGLLSEGGNIVTGNVTSLAGLGNDSRLYQISAPVQPGNSGGPVLDESGRVIAVVVSKLNAVIVAQRSGDIPQNVNFAIKSNVATGFLEGANVSFEREEKSEKLATADIAELAQKFTYLVECRN